MRGGLYTDRTSCGNRNYYQCKCKCTAACNRVKLTHGTRVNLSFMFPPPPGDKPNKLCSPDSMGERRDSQCVLFFVRDVAPIFDAFLRSRLCPDPETDLLARTQNRWLTWSLQPAVGMAVAAAA